MRVNPKTAENLKAISAGIQAQDNSKLHDILTDIGLEALLDEELFILARATHSEPAVLLLATIGKENHPPGGRHAVMLECYQAIIVTKSSNGITTRPAKHLLRQTVDAIINQSAALDLSCDDIGTQVHDWVDAIELAIDFDQPRLAETILKGLIAYRPESEILISLKIRLTQRFTLQRDSIDWTAFARCLGLIHDALHGETVEDEKQDLLLYILESSYKARNWDAIVGVAPLITRKALSGFAAYRSAEAYCQKAHYGQAIADLDRHIALYLEKQQEPAPVASEPRPTAILDIAQAPKEEKDFSAQLAGKALSELAAILEAVGNKMFLVSGTLLGYARTGSVLPHDKDIDVGIFGWESQYDIMEAVIKSKRFMIFPTYLNGQVTFQLPVYHIETGMTIDMFVYHTEGQKFITGVNPPWGYIQRFAFSPFILKEADFLGVKVHVPADIDRNLTENFGNWRVSIPNYISHVESPSTMDQGGLLHKMVCRLNLVEALYKKKPGRIPRILAILDQWADTEGGLAAALYDALIAYAKTRDHDDANLKLAV